ncbi:MAG: CAP domain-containing protein, partial [Patescibacteria group bacterium]|nr:CAP domain-containing protein [Patescibacteria group bacterium]
MPQKKQKSTNQKNWIIFFLLGGFLIKLILFLFKKIKNCRVKNNFKKYIKKEEIEIEEFSNQEEELPEFLRDSLKLFKDFFIPRKGNGHKPKILRTRSLALIVIAVVILKISILAYVFFVNSYKAEMSENISGRIVDLINRDRKSQNLNPLRVNTVLNSSAFSKAEDLIIKNYFAHYSPDGKKPWDFIDRGRYEYLYVGENLAMNFTSAESAHQALMLSPTHKQNILSDKYSDIGIAVINGELDGKKTNVLVQFFAIKKPAPVKIALAEDKTAGTTETIIKIEKKKTQVNPEAKQEEIINHAAPVNIAGESYKQGAKEIKTIDIGRPDKLKIPDSIPVPIQNENLLSFFPEAKNIIGENDKNLIAKAEISPNIAVEKNIITDVKSFNNIFDKNDAAYLEKIKTSNTITMIILGILFIAMIINIVVRAEIQHKKVF